MKSNNSSRLLSTSEIYLIFYNVLQFFGWVIILIQAFHHMIHNGFYSAGIWKETVVCLNIFQTLALLEIVHVSIGIVRSSVIITAIQVFSRVFILWPICNAIPAAQASLGVPLILTCWSITEVIRYSFYFLNIVKMVPFFLVYLRYTLFIVLYPMGVLGEQLCIYYALPHILKKQRFSVRMPNALNVTFDFYYFCLLVMLTYLPGFPQMYLHMFSQRKKILGNEKKTQ